MVQNLRSQIIQPAASSSRGLSWQRSFVLGLSKLWLNLIGRESDRINTLDVAPVFKGLKTVTSNSLFHTNRIVFPGLRIQHALSHRGHALWLRLRPQRYFRSYLVQSSPNSRSYGQYYTGSVRSFKTFCISHHPYTAIHNRTAVTW